MKSAFYILLAVGWCITSACLRNKPIIKPKSQNDSSSVKTANFSYKYLPLDSFRKDSVAYMNYNFIQHNNFYVHKKLAVFFDALEIPIHNFVPGEWSEKTFTTDVLIFHFYSDRVEVSKRETETNPLTIYVHLEKPIDYKLLSKFSKRNTTDLVEPLWDNEARKFLQNKIITSLTLSKDKPSQ